MLFLWDGDLLQVSGEVRLGKGDDTIIVGVCPSHHALTPPVPDHTPESVSHHVIMQGLNANDSSWYQLS